MDKNITATKIYTAYTLDIKATIPTRCPHCKIALSDPTVISFYWEDSFKGTLSLYSIYFCPHCEKAFFVDGPISSGSHSYANHTEHLSFIRHIYPSIRSLTDFPDGISSLSSNFVELYHQSEIAEAEGLSGICGMGYRKSLEFLIKDYAKYKNPDKHGVIESSTLSQCITDYITDERIKSLAKAAAWLGNDESHYERKHSSYNLKDLKAFIAAAVSFIQYDLSYQSALDLLSDPK